MLRAWGVVIVMLVTAATAACSEDEPEADPGGPSAGGSAPAAVRDGLAALFAGDHPGERETANGSCFADELTGRVSLDRLRDAEVVEGDGEAARVTDSLPPLPEDIAEDWADAQLACTDFVEESTRAQTRLSKGRLDEESYAACLAAALSDDDVRTAVVASLSGQWDSEALTALGDAQGACRREATPADEG